MGRVDGGEATERLVSCEYVPAGTWRFPHCLVALFHLKELWTYPCSVAGQLGSHQVWQKPLRLRQSMFKIPVL